MSGYVQSAKASTTSGTSLGILLNGVAAGDDLILGWWFGNTGGSYSASDNVNAGGYAVDVGTLTLATDLDDMGILRKAQSAAGNVTTTWTETGLAANSIRLIVTEALLALNPVDQTHTNNATAAAATTNNAPTTANANDWLFGLIGNAGSGASATITATGGQAARQTVQDSAPQDRFQSADRTVAATGAYAATWTQSASDEYGAIIVAYMLPASGASESLPNLTPGAIIGKQLVASGPF